MTTMLARSSWALAVHGVLVALFLLAGCSSDVVLRHSATGRTAVCPGEYAPGGITTVARLRAVEEQSGCMWYYQQRGYEPAQGG